MPAETQQGSKVRRILVASTKLALGLAIVGLAVQTGMALFEPTGTAEIEQTPNPERELGSWTFAADGFSLAVKSIDVGELEAELRSAEIVPDVDPAIPRSESEKGLLEFLVAQQGIGRSENGRRFVRKQIGGLEVYAEIGKTAGIDRLVVGRAVWASTEKGLTLLEIRPSAKTDGNQTTVDRLVPTPKGAVEMARRVTTTGAVTGSLMTMPGVAEQAEKAMSKTLTAAGWKVAPVDLGKETSSQSLACQRGDDRLQVVVIKDAAADQSMIMCIRD